VRHTDYSQLAGTYDAGRTLLEGNLDRWLALIAHAVGPRPHVELLDLGCGTGRFAIPLAERLGYRVTGADRSPEMLAQARAKPGAEVVQWDLEDASALSYPAERFDVAFIGHVLHHLEAPLAAVREAYRVLRPGGLLLDRHSPIEYIRDDPEHRLFPGALAIDEARGATVEQVEGWFREAGFRGVTSQTIAQNTYGSAAERLRRAGLKATSTLALLPPEAFEEGLAALRAYAAEHPHDPWLVTDTFALTTGRKP